MTGMGDGGAACNLIKRIIVSGVDHGSRPCGILGLKPGRSGMGLIAPIIVPVPWVIPVIRVVGIVAAVPVPPGLREESRRSTETICPPS